MNAVIVIPIYRETLTDSERASLVQCCKVLGQYKMSLVCPRGLNTVVYAEIFNSFKVRYSVHEFDKKYFGSTKTYNQLMLNVDLYRKFEESDFILIYQLDAYVFRDDLKYWCMEGYDFIGAPWTRFDFLRNKMHLIEAGVNGGLSLRKISSFVRVLSSDSREDYMSQKGILAVLRSKIPFIQKERNEDGFFSVYARKIDPTFRVAPMEVAMKFSFEYNPEKLFEMTGQKLPFGCHAWEKYSPEFWKKYIHI